MKGVGAAQLAAMEKGVALSVSHMREEIAQLKDGQREHLTAINENTDEIGSNYEYLIDVESKVERLTARVDELQLMVRDLLLNQIEVTRDDGKTIKLSAFY